MYVLSYFYVCFPFHWYLLPDFVCHTKWDRSTPKNVFSPKYLKQWYKLFTLVNKRRLAKQAHKSKYTYIFPIPHLKPFFFNHVINVIKWLQPFFLHWGKTLLLWWLCSLETKTIWLFDDTLYNIKNQIFQLQPHNSNSYWL